jgi:hypothetical protein
MDSIVTTSEALAAALQVAELGLRVHPLNGKRPIWEDWPSRATSERAAVERMMQPGRNYGIVCDRVAVIDTDTAELAKWWQQHMPHTPWTVRTPRGGAHFYYGSVPELRNATGVDRGWDVRAGGRGYAVGFGSSGRASDTNWIGEATLDLPPFDPAWLPHRPAAPVDGGRRGRAAAGADPRPAVVHPPDRLDPGTAGQRRLFPRRLHPARRGPEPRRVAGLHAGVERSLCRPAVVGQGIGAQGS